MTNLASPWKRMLAILIDNLIFLILELWMLSLVSGSADIAAIMNNLLYLILVMIFGMVVYGLVNITLTAVAGGSIGKLLTGIMVVNPENNKISFWRAVLRNYIGYFVSGLLVWLGYFWAWKDPEHRTWHDMIADTYVVNKNGFGVVTGIMTVLLLAGISGYLVMSIYGLINLHLPLYKNIVTDIATELKPTPTIKPSLTPTPGIKFTN